MRPVLIAAAHGQLPVLPQFQERPVYVPGLLPVLFLAGVSPGAGELPEQFRVISKGRRQACLDSEQQHKDSRHKARFPVSFCHGVSLPHDRLFRSFLFRSGRAVCIPFLFLFP